MCLPFNHKYEKEIKNGYQYCEKCGKAIKIECNCIWEIIERHNVFLYEGDKIPAYIYYILQCKNCGRIIKERT